MPMVPGIGRVAVALVVLALSACVGDPAPPAAGTVSPALPPPAGGDPTPSGAAAMPAGDPCALITPDDVRSAFRQTVTAIARLDVDTDDDGTVIQQCALATDGVPLAGADFMAVSNAVSGFTARRLSEEPATAAIGLSLVVRSTSVDPGAFEVDKFPPGSSVVPGLGVFAVVMGMTGAGGVAYVLTSPTKGIVIYDLEDRQVPAAEMEKLLRAAAARA